MKPRALCAVVAAGATALSSGLVGVATVAMRGVAREGVLHTFAWLTNSALVVGAVAAVLAAVVGWVRAGYRGHPQPGTPPTTGWVWLSALFVALAPAFVMYLLTALWLTNALYVALLAVIIGIPAGLIFSATIGPVGRVLR